MSNHGIESEGAFQQLHETAQDWIRNQKPAWDELREIQRIVIPELLETFRSEESDRDFIVAAPTATGKTEAVFLPIASTLAQKAEDASGAQVLYVCPLTVLIDQQARRLRGMFPEETCPVTPWHGSASRAGKTRFVDNPRGVMIITPESLESQCVNRLNAQGELSRQYGALKVVVIDELHAFFDNPRGYQLLSLLSRLEHGLGRRIPRIGLSATFNEDVEFSVQEFLRSDSPSIVTFLRDKKTARRIKYDVNCFADEQANSTATDRRIMQQILADFGHMGKTEEKHQQKGLVFVNSRQESEHFSHYLAELAEASPQYDLVFHPHHGSLSPQEKDAAIRDINDDDAAAVLVCTTTLELGLDIGSIAQVGQINPGATVASLQQRLGRSGRKHGQLSRLFVYVRESPTSEAARTLDSLHLPTFQALAQVHLVEQSAFERPDRRPAHLSTLIQQILSFTRQYGSITEEVARKVFLEHGPFLTLRDDADGHLELLFARLEAAGLLEKRALGGSEPYYLTANGLGVMEYHQFYAAFQTRTEYGVYSGEDGLLGKIPLGNSYKVGDNIIFARRLWTITSITKLNRVIRVSPAGTGDAPVFPGDPITPSEEVITTMRGLYTGDIEPDDVERLTLSKSAREFYEQGKRAFKERGLDQRSAVEETGGVLLFPWGDDRLQTSLLLCLRYWGLSAMPAKLALFVRGVTTDEVRPVLERLSGGTAIDGRPGIPGPAEAARNAGHLAIDKHDHYLSPYLQRWNFASFRLAMDRVQDAAADMLNRLG